MLEAGPFWDSCSADPLTAAVAPRGHQRARRIDRHLKRAVVVAAGTKEGGRTPGKVVLYMRRWRLWGELEGIEGHNFHKEMAKEMGTYLARGREVFAPGKCCVVSLALDATRLSGRDTLYMALYAPELKLGM
eukprot:4671540-Lingulodinium_polyedra.AAC.1